MALVRGGEGLIGFNWGFGEYRLLIRTVSGRPAAVEIESLTDLVLAPFSVIQAWLQ